MSVSLVFLVSVSLSHWCFLEVVVLKAGINEGVDGTVEVDYLEQHINQNVVGGTYFRTTNHSDYIPQAKWQPAEQIYAHDHP